MVEPFLDSHCPYSQPSSMYTRNTQSLGAMRMAMPVAMASVARNGVHVFRAEVHVETKRALPAHVGATHNQQSRYTESAQALHLSKSEREAICRRLDTPRDSRQRQDVRRQICHAVPTICNHGFGVECPSSDELGNCHSQIGHEANIRYSNARVGSVLGDEVGGIVVMVVAP